MIIFSYYDDHVNQMQIIRMHSRPLPQPTPSKMHHFFSYINDTHLFSVLILSITDKALTITFNHLLHSR